MATSDAALRQGRPKVSETITATTIPNRSFTAWRMRLAEASESSGNSARVSSPGIFEASMPALAQ